MSVRVRYPAGVRTTLNLPDQLVAAVRTRAAREGRTFTSVVEEGLRQVLRESEPPVAERSELPTFGSPDGVFLVDILDRDALWDALDETGDSTR